MYNVSTEVIGMDLSDIWVLFKVLKSLFTYLDLQF